MKNLKRMLTLVLIFSMVVASPLFSFAKSEKDIIETKESIKVKVENENNNRNKNKNENKNQNKNENKGPKQKELREKDLEYQLELELEEELEETETGELKGGENNKEWKELRDKVKEEKKSLKAKDKELKAQIKEATFNGDNELAEQLQSQKDGLKETRKGLQREMVEITRNKYSAEELEEIHKKAGELEKEDEGIEVIPVENIIIDIKNGDITFSAPPIIKDGKTLVPVRDLAEGFGATVEWVSEEQKITVSTDDIKIILQIDSNIAVINGQEVEVDAVSTLYNGSTYVPLRFIAEGFGLEVYYDSETGIIELYDKQENIEDPVDDAKDEEVIELDN